MGRPAASYFDIALCPVHMDHNPTIAPHPTLGPILSGDTKTLINGRFAARQWDFGVHAGCMGPNLFVIAMGSPVVDIGGRPAARMHDVTLHCGIQPGLVLSGAPNVLIGDAPYGGAGTPMAPTPRVAAELRKRDELELKAGGGALAEPPAKPDEAPGVAADGAPARRAFPKDVIAPPAEPKDAPPDGKTPEKVEEELKKDAGQEVPEDKQVPVLAGTLTDQNGTPMPRETVVLQSDAGTELARATLDDKGRYLFRKVQVGNAYKIAVIDPDAEPWTAVEPVTPAAGGAAPKPASDGPHALVVRVVDNGLAPQADVHYTLKLAAGAREGRTDKDGVLCEPSVPAGELELEIGGKAYPVPSQNPAASLLTPFDLVLEAEATAQTQPFIAPPEAPNPLGTLDPVDETLAEL